MYIQLINLFLIFNITHFLNQAEEKMHHCKIKTDMALVYWNFDLIQVIRAEECWEEHLHELFRKALYFSVYQ